MFLLSDGNIKIGFSKRFCARIGEVKREINRRRKAEGKKKLTFKNVYFTPKMSYEDARLVEWASQKKLSPQRVKGEFFSADFVEARAVIDYFVELTTATLPPAYLNLIADKSS